MNIEIVDLAQEEKGKQREYVKQIAFRLIAGPAVLVRYYKLREWLFAV